MGDEWCNVVLMMMNEVKSMEMTIGTATAWGEFVERETFMGLNLLAVAESVEGGYYLDKEGIERLSAAAAVLEEIEELYCSLYALQDEMEGF